MNIAGAQRLYPAEGQASNAVSRRFAKKGDLFRVPFTKDNVKNIMNVDNVNGIETIAAADHEAFGMFLLRDKNCVRVDLIIKNHCYAGSEAQVEAIIDEWVKDKRKEDKEPQWTDFTDALKGAGIGAFSDFVKGLLCEPGSNPARVVRGARHTSAAPVTQRIPLHSGHIHQQTIGHNPIAKRPASALEPVSTPISLNDQEIYLLDLFKVNTNYQDFFEQMACKGESMSIKFASKLLNCTSRAELLLHDTKLKNRGLTDFLSSVITKWQNLGSLTGCKPQTWEGLISALQETGKCEDVIDSIRTYLAGKR